MTNNLDFTSTTQLRKATKDAPAMYSHAGDRFPGLKFNVGKTRTTWYFKGRVAGRLKSIRLGDFPGMTAEQAFAQSAKETKFNASRSTAELKTLRDGWDAYKSNALANKRASEKHLDDMERKLERYASDLLKMRHAQVSLLDVSRCLDAVESVATRHHVKAGINACFALHEVPTPITYGKVKLAKVGDRATFWDAYCEAHPDQDADDWSIMWSAIEGMGNALRRTAWVVMLFTGMRSEDVRELRWEQVDLQRKELSLKKLKSGVDRKLPICDTVVRALMAIRSNGSEFVFPASSKAGYIDHLDALKHNGEPILRQHDCRKHFQEACNEAMLPEHVAKFLRGDKTAGGSQMLLKYSRRVGRSAPDMVETVILERIKTTPEF